MTTALTQLPLLIGITGGIGAGKSVVSRILRSKGISVYDCDFEASRLMQSEEICNAIADAFSTGVLCANGKLNRSKIAELIFNNEPSRRKLESIVHPAVIADLKQWYQNSKTEGVPLFVESAILAQSGIINYCEAVWCIKAPMDIRIDRVKQRSKLSTKEILARIAGQETENKLLHIAEKKIFTINNSDNNVLLQQIEKLLCVFKIQ